MFCTQKTDIVKFTTCDCESIVYHSETIAKNGKIVQIDFVQLFELINSKNDHRSFCIHYNFNTSCHWQLVNLKNIRIFIQPRFPPVGCKLIEAIYLTLWFKTLSMLFWRLNFWMENWPRMTSGKLRWSYINWLEVHRSKWTWSC